MKRFHHSPKNVRQYGEIRMNLQSLNAPGMNKTLPCRPKMAATNDHPVHPNRTAQDLRDLEKNLKQWAFTSFSKARSALEELALHATPQSAYELRLAYYRHASFLENQWQHHDRALGFARQAVDVLESVPDAQGLAEIWADIAGIYQNRREWRNAQESIDRARKYLNENTPAPLRAQVDCREGFLQLHLGDNTRALDNLLKAEEGLTGLDAGQSELKSYYILTLVLSGLGDVYERIDEKEKSLDAYRRVLPIVEEHHLRPRLAWHYLNAGRAAFARENISEAKEYLLKALEWSVEGDAEARTHALGNLGILAILEGNTDRAWSLMDQAAAQYENPEKPGDFTNLSKVESWRAGLMTQTGDYEKARQFLEKAYEYGQQGEDNYHLLQVCHNLAEVNAVFEDYRQAYVWQRRTTEYTNIHFKHLRNRDREDIEALHQLERSRQEAQMAKLRVAGLQLRALRAQMNPHFLFNALNAIQGLITSGRNKEAESYLAKFARLMRQTLEYSDLEVVSLEQEIEFLERYIDINRKLRFRDRLEFRIVPPRGIDLSDLYIPTMILQPFVENAIEHGLRPRQEGALTIGFQLLENEELLFCTIEDDGVGYNKGREKHKDPSAFQKHRSRGMEITGERLNLLHQLQKTSPGAYIRIADIGDLSEGARTGTRVEVLLPILEG
jgi:two-component system, LytTR family, sensor kinase